MKIILIKPYNETDEVQPPLGLGYLATAIRNKHEVEILDCIKENIKLDELKKVLLKKKYEVIGIQMYSRDIYIIKDLSKFIKENLSSKIVVGGPHPSLAPEPTLNDDMNIDFGFKGEAERGFPMLLDYLEQNKLYLRNIPGLIYREKNKIIVNNPYFEENLDNLGEPSWDLLQPDKYPLAPHGAFFKQYPTCPLIITRGCPFSCTYCGGPLISGKKIRSHSIDYVINQIKILNQKYGIKEIHIEDDNFTFNKKFVKAFCNRLIKEKLGITWNCPNGIRLDTLDEELIDLMKKSGLYSVSVGIESGSDKILRLMKKNLSINTIEKKIKLIRKKGLDIIGFFILGYPGETKEDIKKTIKFAKKLKIKRASFMVFKPFPGTEITNELLKKKELEEFDWIHFSLNEVAFSPKGITKKELSSLRKKALYSFYLRPTILLNMLSKLKSPQQVKFVLKRMVRWLK